MKKAGWLNVMALVAVLFSGVAYADQCLFNATVVGVGVGYRDDGVPGCPDMGNCIYFRYKRDNSSSIHTMPINGGYNLNDADIGLGFLSQLKTAVLTGAKIDAWDHWGTRCDDVDEILLKTP